MPQQYYFTADPPPYTPPTFKGDWDDTASAETYRLDSTKTTADLTKFTIQHNEATETSTDPEWKVCLLRFVGGPLIAQTILGTMQMRVGAWQSDPAADLFFALHVYITQGDSDLVRGTLINNFSELVTSQNAWPTEPKGRDLILSAGMNGVTCQDNDRIVIEAGYIARNSVATSYAGALYFGTDYYSNGTFDQIREP